MPVLLKTKLMISEVHVDCHVVNDTADNVKAKIKHFIDTFDDVYNGELAMTSTEYVHKHLLCEEYVFEVIEITDIEAETIRRLIGKSYGKGIGYFVLNPY